MPNILQRIVATKKQEVEIAIRQRPLRDLMSAVQTTPAPRDFLAPFRTAPPIRLIAEVKKASPSKGIIRQDFDPVQIAQAYEAGGASCLSVLTDVDYFQGHLDYLKAVKQAVSLPVLRKDFVIHPYQVFEARVAGADAVLLIAECLSRQELRGLYQLIRELGMIALIELHDPANLDNVINTGTELIGINNRDLTTFEVSLERTIQLRKRIPQDLIVVGESGIVTHADALKLQTNNIQGMLVGESLMRVPDIRQAVVDLLAGVPETAPQ
ncbi:MAG: indole-3-glycerol phosphate synthase TrpC [Pirellulaceae bacterium]|nr:indole-3-glycerol phosphate synthase TrpC [Pirellulaceae bacterium]